MDIDFRTSIEICEGLGGKLGLLHDELIGCSSCVVGLGFSTCHSRCKLNILGACSLYLVTLQKVEMSIMNGSSSTST